MIDLKVLQQQITPSAHVKSIVDVFMSPQGVGRRYLFERNEDSAALASIIDIDGFVDDFVEQGILWNNKPVLHGNEVPDNGIVVNCVRASKPMSAQKRINELQISGAISYYNLAYFFPEIIPETKFISETKFDVIQNLNHWEKLANSFSDSESVEVLNSVLRYRLVGDFTLMNKFDYRPKDQYFEDFMGFGAQEVFVDAGGYDGDTTELFCMNNPDYKKVYLFEPNPISLEQAKIRLKKFPSIEFMELGVSDTVDTLWFNPDNGTASAFGESGSCQINVTTIDQQIDSKVTFIKMDLEGWELKALKGAKRHLMEDHPKLAIAVYHHPSDFWRIFEFIFSVRQDYKVYLRHYTEGMCETVMYFVPKY